MKVALRFQTNQLELTIFTFVSYGPDVFPAVMMAQPGNAETRHYPSNSGLLGPEMH